MNPDDVGRKYDKIASWWQKQHNDGDYGMSQVEYALDLRPDDGDALDVGCGSGGRIVRALQARNYNVTGLDVSSEMIRLASDNHPNLSFIRQDICTWETREKFDFIVAWDSIFHLPLNEQKPVVTKLCCLLREGGVLIFTFGNAIGEHIDEWRGDTFYYSSIGINENLRLLIENGLTVLHLELDQFPETHVCVIAKKT